MQEKKKRKVIGWSTYDYDDFRGLGHDDYTDEVWDAVLQDVVEHGYLFCGEDMQEKRNCCPVLDDYRIARFSRRGFAAIMAEAHGELEYYDYAGYMESCSIDDEEKVFPDGEARPDPRVKILPIGRRCHDLPLDEDLFPLFMDLYTEKEDFDGEIVYLNKSTVPKTYLLPVRQKEGDPYFWVRDAVQFHREDNGEPFPIILFIGRILSFPSYEDFKDFLENYKDAFDEELIYDENRIKEYSQDGKILLLQIR